MNSFSGLPIGLVSTNTEVMYDVELFDIENALKDLSLRPFNSLIKDQTYERLLTLIKESTTAFNVILTRVVNKSYGLEMSITISYTSLYGSPKIEIFELPFKVPLVYPKRQDIDYWYHLGIRTSLKVDKLFPETEFYFFPESKPIITYDYPDRNLEQYCPHCHEPLRFPSFNR